MAGEKIILNNDAAGLARFRKPVNNKSGPRPDEDNEIDLTHLPPGACVSMVTGFSR